MFSGGVSASSLLRIGDPKLLFILSMSPTSSVSNSTSGGSSGKSTLSPWFRPPRRSGVGGRSVLGYSRPNHGSSFIEVPPTEMRLTSVPNAVFASGWVSIIVMSVILLYFLISITHNSCKLQKNF